MIIIAMLKDLKGKQRTFWIIAAVYLTFVMGLSQCRTAILALGCGILLYVIIYSKHKILWIVGIATIAFAFLSISSARQYVRQAFLVEKYSGADLNTVSSGRLDLYSIAWTRIKDHFWLGTGSYYVDCSYISILAESGIIGFLMIERIWVEQIWRNFTWKPSDDMLLWKNLLIMMTGFYIVESLLEGLPPFGPGVCSFAFWYLSERLRNEWNTMKAKRQA